MLIQGLMNQLVIEKLLSLTRRTQNAKNPWIPSDQLVSIKSSIIASNQGHWFHLIHNRFRELGSQIRQKINGNLAI